ncbi:MAG: HD domain-containing protein [Bacillota bacterium]|nr:HD domain-containing protein [Bacillota bacterium]
MPADRLPKLPPCVTDLLVRLESAGFAAWVVGGAVRDALVDRPGRDWDVATSARPEQVLALLPEARPTGLKYGTVTVPAPELEGGGVEVTTFRSDGAYVDGRHPVEVSFTADIEADLARRDFTINALAYHPEKGLFDPFGGAADLARRRLRTVGDPGERLREDALRLMRACRFCAEFRLRPAKEVLQAMRRHAPLLSAVSAERQRDELSKLLLAEDPRRGLRLLRVGGLLPGVLPSLAAAYGLRQSRVHAYSVYYHTLKAVAATPPDLVLRLAALFHDLGKTEARLEDSEGRLLFPGHARLSAEIAASTLHRLAYPRRLSELVVLLVREHMFHWTPKDGPAALRRLLARVGPENLQALVALRRADLLSLRPVIPDDHRLAVLEELEAAVQGLLASRPPVRRQDLALTGRDLMEAFHLPPGPAVGRLLDQLVEDVLDDPARNDRETLLRLAASHLDVGDEFSAQVGRVVQREKDGQPFPPGKNR